MKLKAGQEKRKLPYSNKSFYACDIDFVLVAKFPFRIVAFLDYKGKSERITFSEVIAYNNLITIAPLYVIRSNNAKKGPFDIWNYLHGDPKPEPPVIKDELVRQCETWQDFEEWECSLREKGY